MAIPCNRVPGVQFDVSFIISARGGKLPPMTGYKSGAATRRAILLALLEREPRTVLGLAEAAGLKESNAREHIARMAESGLLTVKRARGRRGSSVTLTEPGREAAKLL